MSAFLAAVTVFFISMQTVIGPTPPGTGVMKPAFSFTPAPRHTGGRVTTELAQLPFVWPSCVLSDTTCSGSVLCVSVIDCYKCWQTIGMFRLLTVLTTVNTWLTRWPQVRCLIRGHRSCCSVLAQSSPDGGKKERERGSIRMSSPSKSTSPMSRTFPVFGSCMRLMPTSMTAAPSFTMSAVIRPGIPAQQGHETQLNPFPLNYALTLKKTTTTKKIKDQPHLDSVDTML